MSMQCLPVDWTPTGQECPCPGEPTDDGVGISDVLTSTKPNSQIATTSGGATLTSPNYNLQIFVAPDRALGDLESTNYRLRLSAPTHNDTSK